jgi:hypothetical protein
MEQVEIKKLKISVVYLNRLSNHIKGFNEKRYLESDKTIDAVFYCIETFANTANSLSNNFKLKYSDIPWRMISLLCVKNSFEEEESFEIAKDFLSEYTSRFNNIYLLEIGQTEVNKIKAKHKYLGYSTSDDKIDSNYSDPNKSFNLKTNNSIWTVKKH